MKVTAIYVFLHIFVCTTYAQDYQYYFFNKDQIKCPPDSAEYIRTVIQDSVCQDTYKVYDSYVNGGIRMKAKYFTLCDTVDWSTWNIAAEDSRTIKTDTCIWYYKSKKMRRLAVYDYGFKNGPYVEWYSDGSRKLAGYYVNGREDGDWKFWPEEFDANMEFRLNYGELHGTSKYTVIGRYESFLDQFFNGVKVGKQVRYHNSNTINVTNSKFLSENPATRDVFSIKFLRFEPGWKKGDTYLIFKNDMIKELTGDSIVKDYRSQLKFRIKVIEVREYGYIVELRYLNFSDNQATTIHAFDELPVTTIIDSLRNHGIEFWISKFGRFVMVMNREEMRVVYKNLIRPNLIKYNTIEFLNKTEMDTISVNKGLAIIDSVLLNDEMMDLLFRQEIIYFLNVYDRNFFPGLLVEQKIKDYLDKRNYLKYNRTMRTGLIDKDGILSLNISNDFNGNRLKKLFKKASRKLISFAEFGNLDFSHSYEDIRLRVEENYKIDTRDCFLNGYESVLELSMDDDVIEASSIIQVGKKQN